MPVPSSLVMASIIPLRMSLLFSLLVYRVMTAPISLFMSLYISLCLYLPLSCQCFAVFPRYCILCLSANHIHYASLAMNLFKCRPVSTCLLVCMPIIPCVSFCSYTSALMTTNTSSKHLVFCWIVYYSCILLCHFPTLFPFLSLAILIVVL